MPLSKEAKSLIGYYVSKRKAGYFDLSYPEKAELVSEILRHSASFDTILVDADYDCILPDLIADMIDKRSSLDSVKKLIDGIMGIFVLGTAKRYPAFYHEIEEYFEEEWAEQWPEPNEHWVHDCRQRARDAGGT